MQVESWWLYITSQIRGTMFLVSSYQEKAVPEETLGTEPGTLGIHSISSSTELQHLVGYCENRLVGYTDLWSLLAGLSLVLSFVYKMLQGNPQYAHCPNEQGEF